MSAQDGSSRGNRHGSASQRGERSRPTSPRADERGPAPRGYRGGSERRRDDRGYRGGGDRGRDDRGYRGTSDDRREGRRSRDGGRARGASGAGQRPRSGHDGGGRRVGHGRPGQERREQRPAAPAVPEWVTGTELDGSIRSELRALSKESAERVSKHLVAALSAVEDDDLETALAHAEFAGRIGARVGAVREIYGAIAYELGDFKTAGRELRTAMRITGRRDVLPMIADCERGLGRPEKALDLAASPEAAGLDEKGTIELMIVVAGAYADTGDIDTALTTLDIPALRQKVDGQWQVRLWVAYATLLETAGRSEDAARWLSLAADADTDGITDAASRLGRPARAPKVHPDPSWEDAESISIVDAYDDEEALDEEGREEEESSGEHAGGERRAVTEVLPDGEAPVDTETSASGPSTSAGGTDHTEDQEQQ